MNRVITYIDGFNLYYGLRDRGWKRFYWLNLRKMSENLLRPDQTLVRTKYFTSRVSPTRGNPNKHQRQADFIDALTTVHELDIFYGQYLSNPVECRRCGARWDAHEEKMTDVNIAIHLLQDAHDDKFDTAILISGDSDLSGPIEMIRLKFPKKRIIVAFPPRRNSGRLKRVAHGHFIIGESKFRNALFPDTIQLTDDVSIQKPPTWI